MPTITVNGPSPYPVTIGHDLTDELADFIVELAPAKVAIIHQPTLTAVARRVSVDLKTRNLDTELLAIPDAEEGKTLDVCGQLWDRFGELGFGRRDVVIGLGGGAATDLAGFVAAAWMRGVRVVQMPTTLLGMVDAAVGGKTGINTAAGKNLVGAFHEPTAVFIDLDILDTLPEQELIAGSAEIIKTGFIADERILEIYEAEKDGPGLPASRLAELVERSVAVKAAVVGEDLKESGLRETLNYGHTFGHAIELRENYAWRHGHAVAVGMMFVAELAHARGLISRGLVRRHRSILQSVGLPTTYEPGHFDELYDAMTRDKKNRGGAIRFVVLDGGVGSTTRLVDATVDELRAAYAAISEGF